MQNKAVKISLATLAMSATMPLMLFASEPQSPEPALSTTPSESSETVSVSRENPYEPETIDCDTSGDDEFTVPDDLVSSPEEAQLASDVVAFVLGRMCTDLLPAVNEIIVAEVNKAIAATQDAERHHYDPEIAGRDAQIASLEGSVRAANRRIAELQRSNLVEDLGKFALGSLVGVLTGHLLDIGE